MNRILTQQLHNQLMARNVSDYAIDFGASFPMMKMLGFGMAYWPQQFHNI